MKVYSVVQGSSEWLQLRAGIPTASEFDKIVTPGGKPSTSAELYMYRLLAERIIGPEREFVSLWAQRGSEDEIKAVKFYELQADIDTTPVGFVTNDAGTVGCSPDRLVGEVGLLEIKVPSPAVHMKYLLTASSAYEANKCQIQGQLWVSEREWVDVLSWHPRLPHALIRVQCDEAFIAKLASLVTAFSVELEKQYQVLLEKGWLKTSAETVTEQLESSLHRLAPLHELVAQAKEAMKSI